MTINHSHALSSPLLPLRGFKRRKLLLSLAHVSELLGIGKPDAEFHHLPQLFDDFVAEDAPVALLERNVLLAAVVVLVDDLVQLRIFLPDELANAEFIDDFLLPGSELDFLAEVLDSGVDLRKLDSLSRDLDIKRCHFVFEAFLLGAFLIDLLGNFLYLVVIDGLQLQIVVLLVQKLPLQPLELLLQFLFDLLRAEGL